MQTDKLEIMGQIADLKDVDYRNTLAISVLIELLIEQGLFTKQEFAQKARQLESQTWGELMAKHKKKQPQFTQN